MDERTRRSLVWGLSGCLTFLVLVQTVRLFGDLPLGLPRLVPIALVVGVATTGIGWYFEGRLGPKRQV